MSEQVFSDIQAKNQAFINAFLASPEGSLEKLASTASDSIIKRKLREDSFVQAILPLEDYSRDNSAFAQAVDREDPFIIYEMEADQFGPKTLSWQDTGDIREFAGNKFILTFTRNTTPVFTKNVQFLRTYKHDLTQLVEDNCARDLNRQKDFIFTSNVDDMCGKPGTEKNVYYNTRLNKSKHAFSTQLLADRSLPTGVFLCNRRTAAEVLQWDPEVFERSNGGMTEKITREGLGAFDKFHIHGVDYIVTQKNDIVPNGTVYQFTTPDFLGKAGSLQPMKMFIEKKEDIIRWHATEMLGFAIANEDGVQKVTYVQSAFSNGNDGRLSPEQAALARQAIIDDNPAAYPAD